MRPFVPVYAPDGMTAGGDSADFLGSVSVARAHNRFEAVQAHERHDDGLVHGHRWATSDSAHPGHRPAAARVAGATFGVPMPVSSTRYHHRFEAIQPDDRYDDGLVHNHDWAVTGR
jgi:hypothetical protein